MSDTSAEKPCKDCGITKSLSAFYKHKMMADGHLNSCKECKKAYQTKHREENVEAAREYDRKRHKEQPQRREHINKVVARAKARNPGAIRAVSKLNDAIRRGHLIKQPCQVCGRVDHVHGHHDDYSKPLHVMWLCPVHHRERHRQLGWGFGAAS